ncbi:MAG: aromatic hydrocarbon degradation protein [Rhizobiales bacterium 63-22]|nr:MAG: aromatic hydrocarbon degradation protein [Rhizobiales bacterium 63-22]
MNTFRSYTAIEQKITSRDFGINCSYRIPVGEKGYFRILGGVSYQELKGYQSKLVPPGTPFGGTFRVATLDVEDRGVGWRIGGAYELPEYALRATLVYQSEVKYNLDGTISNLAPIPLNVNSDVAAPQSVEFKFQTGIAPDWLAMASVKWTDWKSIQSIAFTSVNNTAVGLPNGRKITSLDLYYRDGWTIMGGIGHKFNEKWSGAATVTWDRGTSTGWTSQTNLWLFGLAADFKPQKHLSFRLAGAVGWLGSGTLKDTVSTSDFGNDLVTALSLTAKVKF